MSDPVFVASGHTFERAAIEEWFKDGNDINPLTGETLSTLDIKFGFIFIFILSLFQIHQMHHFVDCSNVPNVATNTLDIQTQLRSQGMSQESKYQNH